MLQVDYQRCTWAECNEDLRNLLSSCFRLHSLTINTGPGFPTGVRFRFPDIPPGFDIPGWTTTVAIINPAGLSAKLFRIFANGGIDQKMRDRAEFEDNAFHGYLKGESRK
jgi:hypothetical protein